MSFIVLLIMSFIMSFMSLIMSCEIFRTTFQAIFGIYHIKSHETLQNLLKLIILLNYIEMYHVNDQVS